MDTFFAKVEDFDIPFSIPDMSNRQKIVQVYKICPTLTNPTQKHLALGKYTFFLAFNNGEIDILLMYKWNIYKN